MKIMHYLWIFLAILAQSCDPFEPPTDSQTGAIRQAIAQNIDQESALSTGLNDQNNIASLDALGGLDQLITADNSAVLECAVAP